jgi:tetratricopeptide (TPR) repeat protein
MRALKSIHSDLLLRLNKKRPLKSAESSDRRQAPKGAQVDGMSRTSAGAGTFATAANSSGLAWILFLAAGFLAQSSVLHAQTNQAAGTPQSSMKMHYDAAFRFQDAGDPIRASSEYKLYLSMALHHIANGHANLGDYAHAVEPYEESLRLAPEDSELKMDYAAAALDASDWRKAKVLASSVLDSLSRNAKPPDAHAVTMLGQALLELGEHQEAIQQFKLAVELHPGFDSSFQLAAAYLVLGDQLNAARILDEMSKEYPNTAALHMKLGSLYGNTKFFDAAISEFRKAIAMDDRFRGAHYSLGATFMMQLNESGYDKAEAEFRKESAIDPENTLVYMPLGRIFMSRHLYAEAEANLKHAAEANPQDASTHLALGQLYKEVGKTPEEERALRKSIALTLDPSANNYEIEQAHYWLGRLLVEKGDAAEGRKELDIARNLLYLKEQLVESRLSGSSLGQMSLEKTHAADPNKLAALKALEKQSGPIIASSYANLGANAANAGEFADASSYFEQAAKWNPALPGIDENWGRAAYAAREYAKAVGPLSRALALHPTDARARGTLGLSLCLVRDYAGALQVLQPIEEKLDAIPELSIAYAGAMAITSDSNEGLARLESLEQAHPELPLAHYLLGEAYASKKQYRESADELRIALKLDPSSAETKNALVTADLALGEKADALQILSDLAESEPQDGEVHYRLAQLQIELGMAKDAIGNLDTAIRLNPNVASYHHELAEAYRKNAQPEEAEREARQSDSLQELGSFN